MYWNTDVGATTDKISDDRLFTVPHFLFPSLNCSLELGKQNEIIRNSVTDYRSIPYEDTLPIPLNDPLLMDEKSTRGVDHVTKLISDKSVWENEKNDLLYRNSRLKSRYYFETDDTIRNWNKISKETVRLADHIDCNPDSDFSGFYNWYYSDGCLNNISHNNITSLLYSNESLPGTCIATPLSIKKLKCSLLKDNSVFLNTGHNQRIFQITVKNNFVAILQKKCTSLFTLTSDSELQFNKIHSHSETKNNIVSVSVSNDLDGKYCTLTTSRILKLWSPNVKTDCISCVNIKKSEAGDSWGSVKYLSNNNILVSNRESVFLKDTRIELAQNVQEWKVQGKEEPCNFISMLMKSHVEENCVYIGTLHNLYELDFRNGLSKQWTHMMEFPPMYGDSNLVDNSNETLFIGSQSINEVCTINSDLHVMPYILSSPDETLSKTNLQGLCLNPVVASRFNFSMTGLTTVSDSYRNNLAFVFRATSIGDIFYQGVIPKNGCDNDLDHSSIDLDRISRWEVKCEKFEKPVNVLTHSLKVTDLVDFDKLLSRKNFKPLEFKNQNLCDDNKLDWMIDASRLMEPSDKFSKLLVDVWEIETAKTKESNAVGRQGSSSANDNSESKQIYHYRQTSNNFNYEEREKRITESDLALNEDWLKSSRNHNRNIASHSSDSGNKMNCDYLHLEGHNEMNWEECSSSTSDLPPPKKIAKNEIKRKVTKKAHFTSGF